MSSDSYHRHAPTVGQYLLACFVPLSLGAALLVSHLAAAMQGYEDQYPDDSEAFACQVPPVDVTNDGATPIECSLLLTRCIDTATHDCVAVDPKGCRVAHEACFAMVDEVCWPAVGD